MTETAGRPGWMVDELVHAGRENLDADHVARYDDIEDADAVAEVRLLQELGLHQASTVLELGPGTGQFTLAVAPVCNHVIAVDVSPVMLARLASKMEARNVTNIESVHAGVLGYEHHGDPVDIAYSRYALHHLPDFWKAVALTKIHDVLRPGGVFRLWDVVYGFDPDEAPARVEAWCATAPAVGDHQGTAWTRADLEEHVRDEHSTFTWLLEPMIERAGFTIEAADYSDDRFSAKYVLRKPAG